MGTIPDNTLRDNTEAFIKTELGNDRYVDFVNKIPQIHTANRSPLTEVSDDNKCRLLICLLFYFTCHTKGVNRHAACNVFNASSLRVSIPYISFEYRLLCEPFFCGEHRVKQNFDGFSFDVDVF